MDLANKISIKEAFNKHFSMRRIFFVQVTQAIDLKYLINAIINVVADAIVFCLANK